MLMKLTAGVNFINVFCVRFSYKRHVHIVQVTRKKLPKRRLYEKNTRKMLMKLTKGELDKDKNERE